MGTDDGGSYYGVRSQPAYHTTLVISILQNEDKSWRPSKSWYRNFVMQRLGLSFLSPTKDHGSLPLDYEERKHMLQARLVWTVTNYNVSPDFCYNMDETGVCLLPTLNKTWAAKATTSVSKVGLGEKRQFTATTIINACGSLVGQIQVIWGGKTERCEPPQVIKDRYTALSHTHTESHWVNTDTL